MPNKLSQFWQELKRRNVVRVITVYAGAAFVLLELVDMITDPFGLPAWTFKLAVVILSLGFVVAVILSWIYDVYPEGGMVKTEPADKVKPEEMPKPSSGWKIASYISFVVILGLIILNIISRSALKEISDKSIAVLPFRNESSDESNTYFINGTMESILDNLCRIKDLLVPARTSVEQYRDVARSIPEIARELNVSYILEGSGQKIGNRILLTVQLIEGENGYHIWSKQYDREIIRVEDLIDIQSEIARLIAGELQALVVPEEQQRIDRSPTTDLAAYEVYLRANARREEFLKKRDQHSFDAAVELYNTALALDSTFARAFSGLASVYFVRYASETFFDETYLDTVLTLSNKAVYYDDQLDEAYFIRSRYHLRNGHFEEALSNLDKALEINPNYAEAYVEKGFVLYRSIKDYREAIENYQKALSLIYGVERPSLLASLSSAYIEIGIMDLAEEVMDEKLDIDGDSASWLDKMAWEQVCLGNIEEAYRFGRKAALLNQTGLVPNDAMNLLPSTYRDVYYEHILKLSEWYEDVNILPLVSAHRIGYGFYQVGKIEEAERYFRMQIKYSEESIRLGRHTAQTGAAQYDLAATYAFTGEIDKAYRYLNEFGSLEKYPSWMVVYLNHDPLLDPIRDEPEFQQIVRNVEAKYQAEHERVRKWLEEKDML